VLCAPLRRVSSTNARARSGKLNGDRPLFLTAFSLLRRCAALLKRTFASQRAKQKRARSGVWLRTFALFAAPPAARPCFLRTFAPLRATLRAVASPRAFPLYLLRNPPLARPNVRHLISSNLRAHS
jgi:hypothetical protein